MIEKSVMRFLVLVMAVYLAWVWGFDIDKSGIPDTVKHLYWMQENNFILLPDNLVVYLHDFRPPLAFISLFALWFYHSFGRWGFLLFSITGATMYLSDGWLYKPQWQEDLEYGVQMMQGAFIGISFFGVNARKFRWKLGIQLFGKNI